MRAIGSGAQCSILYLEYQAHLTSQAMAILVGLTGLGGAGKTTAATYFEKRSVGQRAYLGAVVLDEVKARGLEPTAENERLVRVELRSKYGKGFMAVQGTDRVAALLARGINVFVDAIFEIEEYWHLLQACKPSSSVLLALEASFPTRCGRLQTRQPRPITAEELQARDDTEITGLGTRGVMEQASHVIDNEGDMQTLEAALGAFWVHMGRGRGS